MYLSADGGTYVVKSGFTSGYNGTGPSGFSGTLALLGSIGATVDEVEVGPMVLQRCDACTLTSKDIVRIREARCVLPSRIHDYIRWLDYDPERRSLLWSKVFRPQVPLTIIDSRLTDIAQSFWDNPDNNLNLGYRRLEDIFRKRLKSNEVGRALFASAFLSKPVRLTWKACKDSEHEGRAFLFIGMTQAHRNPRAHQEKRDNDEEMLSEFLLLNHLYRLEAMTIRKR